MVIKQKDIPNDQKYMTDVERPNIRRVTNKDAKWLCLPERLPSRHNPNIRLVGVEEYSDRIRGAALRLIDCKEEDVEPLVGKLQSSISCSPCETGISVEESVNQRAMFTAIQRVPEHVQTIIYGYRGDPSQFQTLLSWARSLEPKKEGNEVNDPVS